MYLMMVMVCIGVAIILSNVWILVFTPVCAWSLYYFAIAPEEAYLGRKFGESYRRYKTRVRRWL
jgi:protein-S-isoprenylcysteine O-methyltransferase Ste14